MYFFQQMDTHYSAFSVCRSVLALSYLLLDCHPFLMLAYQQGAVHPTSNLQQTTKPNKFLNLQLLDFT